MSVYVKVDPELAYIIEEMKKDPTVNKAIRRYARAFIGYDDTWMERYKKEYEP